MRTKVLELAVLLAFAASSVACGVIEAPVTLALEEGSSMDIELFPDDPAPIFLATVDLEGGVEAVMSVEIGLFDLLFQRPVMGLIEVDDMLFAGTPFSIVGTPTEEVCVIKDPAGSSGGTVLIDLFDKQINNASVQFVMDLATAIVVGNPVLADAIPGGFPLVLSVDSEADLSLAEMLSLILGDAEGGLAITQELDETFLVNILGLEVPLGVTGELTLATVNAFPTGPLLDDCIALLNE